MLLDRNALEGIRAGRVHLAFRRWRRPTVKTGGTLRTAVGVLAIEAVESVDLDALTAADARGAGFESLDELRRAITSQRPGTLYRIRVSYAGPDPRIALRENDDLGPEEIEQLRARLGRMDAASPRGPWTRATLELIEGNEGVRAPDLAAGWGLDTPTFKRSVRRLKELGLTESLKVGYRLSPRGRRLLRALRG